MQNLYPPQSSVNQQGAAPTGLPFSTHNPFYVPWPDQQSSHVNFPSQVSASNCQWRNGCQNVRNASNTPPRPIIARNQWHSGMSPHPYTLCELPNATKKCYGCGEEFVDKYRVAPYNIVVRHVDRRIQRRDEHTGTFLYSPDFTNTYYHPICSHMVRKNPTFPGFVQIELEKYNSFTLSQQLHMASFDFDVNFT